MSDDLDGGGGADSGFDLDGYGFSAEDRTPGRLIADVRVLSPLGIERIAEGWDDHVGTAGADDYGAAEQSALRAVEAANRGRVWDQLRRALFGLTEDQEALVSWKIEHGEIGSKAERAALGAAVGLLASDLIDREQVERLLRPMAEALPWLLPNLRPRESETEP